MLPPIALAACFFLLGRSPASADGEVRVKPGDTLSAIALAYYGDAGRAGAIASYNGLSASGRINAGQVLRLPAAALLTPVAKMAPAAGQDSVRIGPGDTLSSLSVAYYGDGGHVQAIARANGLHDPSAIKAGQVLVLPRDPQAKRPIPMVQSGVATWYGPGFEGKTTKCGQVYHQWEISAASNDLPCGAVVEVTNVRSPRSVVVSITDTGAFQHPNILDLSRGAFARLASTATGVIPIRLRVRSLPSASTTH